MSLLSKLTMLFAGKKGKVGHRNRYLLEHKENWKKCKSCKKFNQECFMVKPLSKACEKYVKKK